MKTFENTTKRSRTVLTALFAALCAVMLLYSFAASSDVNAAGLVEFEEGEGEWDVFATEPAAPDGSPAHDPGATILPATESAAPDGAPTRDPNATALPTTERGEHILFEGTDEGGSGKTSAGSIIMIIIVVAAILSIVSGIVEKIVKYYKNRDKNYYVD